MGARRPLSLRAQRGPLQESAPRTTIPVGAVHRGTRHPADLYFGRTRKTVPGPATQRCAVQYLPFSSIDTTKPRDLYNWLEKTANEAGTDFVAIAHNMNLSGGSMFPLYDESGRPIDLEYAELRERWEPVDEVTQYKGDSETHPKLSPNDQFADFERWDLGNLLVT